MKTRLLSILLLSALITSCVPANSLWGVASTPTPDKVYTIPTVFIPPPTSMPVLNTVEAPIFTPSPTATHLPTLTPTVTPTHAPITPGAAPILYYTLSGDSLPAISHRFGVAPDQIIQPDNLTKTGFIEPNTLLMIPHVLGETGPADQIMPDSEVVYSPSAIGFDIRGFVSDAGGYLSTYRQYMGTTGWTSGADVIQRQALENSINPRLILALIEFQSNWVYGQPENLAQRDYPLGHVRYSERALYQQIVWATKILSTGYYGWRNGSLTSITLEDGQTIRLNPTLNAGTVAIQYFFAQNMGLDEWQQTLDPRIGFAALYHKMYGDPWARAAIIEPLFPPTLQQPLMNLPYAAGQAWSFSGGPHAVWDKDGALAALDFAPTNTTGKCEPSPDFVLSMTSGLVVRSNHGAVMIDTDGDGHEQTGWNILYMHIYKERRVQVGDWVNMDDPVGHPSCEGGTSTGTHVHIARKYNGEWILADGPVPFVLSGWVAHNGDQPYEGYLTKGDQIILANPFGAAASLILRPLE